MDPQQIESYPIILYKHIVQIGKKQPALLPFYLPPWKDHDEVFWQSLGDYVILAVHRVKDLAFDRSRGRIKVTYFEKIKGRIKYPKDIGEITQKIAYLVDTESVSSGRDALAVLPLSPKT